MPGGIKRLDPWAFGTFFGWVALLALGLFPELSYQALRDSSNVVTQTAWVNSPLILIGLLTLFVGYFTYQRTLEATPNRDAAMALGVQMSMCAIFAFLPLNPTDFFGILDQPLIFVVIVWSMGGVKALCWLYIFSLFFRYYILHSYGVFGAMASVFPSGRPEKSPDPRYEKPDPVYDPTTK